MNGQVEQRRGRVTESDTLQDAGEPQVVEVVKGKAVDQQTKNDEQDGTAEDVGDELCARAAPRRRRASVEKTMETADDEEEGGEDHVGGCRSLPCGVEERQEDSGISTRIGDENHAGDGEAAHYVEGEEAGGCGREG